VPRWAKAPKLPGWQKLEIDDDQVDTYFSDRGNVGLLLGKRSRGLIDVDLDAPEAESTADVFLPPTEMVHGRKSKPFSHFWYRVEQVPSPLKFCDAAGTCLVEIRSAGQQTLAPPSTHPSGEAVRWQRQGAPGKVKSTELIRAVQLVASSSLLARSWPDQGSRNEASLALAGMLLRGGWSLKETMTFLRVTARAAGDDEWKVRPTAASSTQERLANQGEATGASRLRELVGDAVVTRLQEWLDLPQNGFIARDGENLTDLGNARRLVKQFGDKIRFCHEGKRWYRYTGMRWKPDTDGAVERLAKKIARRLSGQSAVEGSDISQKRITAWAMASESRGRITAMIDLAKSELGIPVDLAELDSDPWLLNFRNGTVDLRTGKLRKHEPADLCTKIIPFEFEPDAACPLFKKFLRRIFDNNVALIQFVQRAFGYSLTGSTREQVILVFWGSGANGKSTLLETIRAGLGDYACTADSSLLMTKTHDGVRNDVARLAGARFVSTGETEAGRYLSEALVKQLTGSDKVTARFLYSEFFEFDAQFKVFLATNHKPIIRGNDNAIWRRIRLVPFLISIPDSEQDKSLSLKLRKELPGIIAWAVRGCLRWQEIGLTQPEEVLTATQAYRNEMDILGAFLRDRCLEGEGFGVTARELYATYRVWCETNGERPLTQQRFGVALADRGFRRSRTGRARFWLGLQCRNTGDANDAGDVVVQ